MAVVIEQLNRSGRVVERHRFGSSLVAIGRSYENNIIINDEYVDPFHLNVELMDDGSFTIHDKSSLNGVKLQKGHRITVSDTINSGDTIEFGRSHLRIIDPYHIVSPAERLSRTDKALNELTTWPFITLLVAAIFAKELWLLYGNTPGEFDLQKYSNGLINYGLSLLAYTVAWSAIGRLLRGESRFFSHAICIMLALLSYWVLQLLQSLLIYNYDLFELMSVTNTLVIASLIAVLSWSGLYLSTNTNSLRSTVSGVIIASVWLVYTLIPDESSDFSPFPNHNSVILAPQFQFVEAITVDSYLKQIDGLFEPKDSN